METTEFKGQMIVAMPHLEDPNFKKTVVFLCDHGPGGSMGVVINRPLPFTLDQVYAGQGITAKGGGDHTVNFGGPVQPEVGFILYRDVETAYENSTNVTGDVFLGTTVDILQDISNNNGPDQFFFALGYAGWGPEQLEDEITRNDWLVVPFDLPTLFDLPHDQRWEHAIRLLGVDPNLLTQTTGSA